MLDPCEVQLMMRCADYVHELAEIYGFGGTENRHILRDLEEIEGLIKDATKCVLVDRCIQARGKRIRWVDDIEHALAILGGQAHLSDIERVVRRLRANAGRSWPTNAEACIRDALETHSSNSMKYTQLQDLFELVDRGSGVWRLRLGAKK